MLNSDGSELTYILAYKEHTIYYLSMTHYRYQNTLTSVCTYNNIAQAPLNGMPELLQSMSVQQSDDRV